MDARADAASQRAAKNAIVLGASAWMDPDGAAGTLSVDLTNLGSVPVTVTRVIFDGRVVEPAGTLAPPGVLLPGAYTPIPARVTDPVCGTGTRHGRVVLAVEAHGADGEVRRIEIPVAGAGDVVRELDLLLCQDLAARVAARFGNAWERQRVQGRPAIHGDLEISARPFIGVKVLGVSASEPFHVAVLADDNAGVRVAADRTGFAANVWAGDCAQGAELDRALLDFRVEILADDGRRLETRIELTTESAAALVELYDLACGNAPVPIDDAISAASNEDGWEPARIGGRPAVRGLLTVVLNADQVALTKFSEASTSVDVRLEWDPPLRLSGRGTTYPIDFVVYVDDCSLDDLAGHPGPSVLMHGSIGNRSYAWIVSLPLYDVAQRACAHA